MTSRSTATSRRSGTRLTRLLAVACALAVGTLLPLNASAELTSIAARPEQPDGLRFRRSLGRRHGTQTRATTFSGSSIIARDRSDMAGPIPVYEIRVQGTIQEPNPIATWCALP